MIEILSNGALNLVQDLGRPGCLSMGVSHGGAMDVPALQYANLLLGNDKGAAGIEITIFPFRVRCTQSTYIACTGAAVVLEISGRAYPVWSAVRVEAGDVLMISPPQVGSRAMLAFQGGIAVPKVLGSSSTDLKSGFGGLEGRGLSKLDQLVVGPPQTEGEVSGLSLVPRSRTVLAAELASGVVTVRALAGSDYEEFSVKARKDFEQTEYKLTPDCNRQGYRLEGAALKTRRKLELLSHGVVPGTVQVPPAGQPIVQMAEANTIGGYPRVATVILADLWRLAQMRPGQAVRFVIIDGDCALQAGRDHDAEYQKIRAQLAEVAIASLNLQSNA